MVEFSIVKDRWDGWLQPSGSGLLGLLLVMSAAMVVSGLAQRRVARENRHERVLAVVPMVGSGTHPDPRRPMFAEVAHGGRRFADVPR